MNADNFGSFSIACRLMHGLCSVTGKADPTSRRQRLLQSFLEKFATATEDLTLLFELLSTELSAFSLRGRATMNATSETSHDAMMRWSVLDDHLVGSCDALALQDVPFATYGNLAIREAHKLCLQLRAVVFPPEGTAAAISLPAAVAKALQALPESVTLSEWETLKSIVIGDATKTLGAHYRAIDLLSFLGPVASSMYATQGNIRLAVVASCDGSPRMMRESSAHMTTVADDALAGFASDEDEDNRLPAAAVVAPSAAVHQSLKRPREDEKHNGHAAPPPPRREGTPPPPPECARKLYPCMYGATCRRTNPDHFKKYSHPPDHRIGGVVSKPIAAALPTSCSSSAVATDGPVAGHALPSVAAKQALDVPLDPSAFAIKGVAPLRAMKEHEFVFVDNSGGGHKMKNCGGGTYTCSCPVWRYQNKATNERTCKHLEEYLGSAYERVRCGGDVEAAATAAGRTGAAPRAGSPLGGKKVAMPGVLLANKCSPAGDYKGWWVSEKLDGVRAYWDGTHMLSRNGNIFTVPDCITKDLPKDKTLDGELFGGRKKFQSTVGIVKSSASHPGWANLTYEIFDIPSSGEKPFEARMEELKGLFPKGGPAKQIHVVEHEVCKGTQHVADRLAEIEALGGEGLMLREPGSRYIHSRSNTLLKVKSTEEVDAIVRGHDPGKGKHAGRCGALLVELANGKQFCVGSGLSDAQRSAPPSVGTVVIVKFQELTDGGIPRFPVFVGCRYDIDWPPKAGK